MNFFAAQDQARSKTKKLVFLFVLAVLSLVGLTVVLVTPFFVDSTTMSGSELPLELWLAVAVGVIAVVCLGALFKHLALRGGGKAVAESLGGVLIHQSTGDAKHRQVLNVVEEMAIAAGTPVPPVYLIREDSINAFAAGFTIQDAVIGINQGTIDLLNREELQGVIAHEFSHILHGDMRINIRLIALLNGILIIGIIGQGLMRGAFFTGGYRRSNNNNMGMMAIGLGLLVIGYAGIFFGNLIKAAVSRQREYLADASAVQFTRSNTGIANALKKIGGHSMGSSIAAPSAEENSHLFFGAIKKFGSMMATHPPLPERIRALEPEWDGKFLGNRQTPPASGATRSRRASTAARAATAGFAGHCGEVELAHAQELIAQTDESVRAAAHDTYEARALVYAMLVNQRPNQQADRDQQLKIIEQRAEQGVYPLVLKLLPSIASSNAQARLTALDMAVPTLKEMSFAQYQRFYQVLGEVIVADDMVDLFEWVLHRVITQELYSHFVEPHRRAGNLGSSARVKRAAAGVLELIAAAGSEDLAAKQSAYARGTKILGLQQAFRPNQPFDYGTLNTALGHLRDLKPSLKKRFVDACAAVATEDNYLSDDEFALIKGITATLNCPLPPLSVAA